MLLWRSRTEICCSVAPSRNIELASECRNKCAAPRLGRVTPARRMARSTSTDTAQCDPKGRKGARQQTNNASWWTGAALSANTTQLLHLLPDSRAVVSDDGFCR